MPHRIYRDAVLTTSGCVEWRGATNKGYGVMWFGKPNQYPHRIACEIANGSAPEGLNHALHKCNNRLCINGEHLYWGNNQDNARDRMAAGTARGHARPSHCINGHEYTEENTYHESRGIACKICRRNAVRRYRAQASANASARL